MGTPAIFIITSSVEFVQKPLAIVHRRVTEFPTVSPVIVEVGEEAFVIVAVPEITVQVPKPVVGVFPERVLLVTLHKF